MKKNIILGAVILIALQLSGCSQSMHKKSAPVPTPVGNTIAEQNNACANEFEALNRVSPETYNFYLGQFNELNNAYQIYKQNAAMVNKDARDTLGMELDSKLKLICARVKSATFQNMTKRAQDINKL